MKINLFLKATAVSVFAFIIAYGLYPYAKDVLTYPNPMAKLYGKNGNYKTFNQDLSFKDVKTVVIKAQTSNLYIEPTQQDNGKVAITTGANQTNVLKFKNEDTRLTLELPDLSQFAQSSMTVKLPGSVKVLIINTVSGNIDVNRLDLDKIDINSTQGNINLHNGRADEVTVKSVQGQIQCDVDIKKLMLNSVSGNVWVKTKNENPEYRIKTVSGSILVTLPQRINAVITLHSLSGKIVNSAKFQLVDSGRKGFIRVESISGNVEVRSHR